MFSVGRLRDLWVTETIEKSRVMTKSEQTFDPLVHQEESYIYRFRSSVAIF